MTAWLVWLFGESALSLWIVAALANFWVLVYWRRSGRVRPLLIGLATAAVLLVVEQLVVTQREHADRILTKIATGLENGSAAAFGDALSVDFRAGSRDADEMTEWVQAQLGRIDVVKAHRTALSVRRISADRCEASASYFADVAARGGFSGYTQSRWTFTLVRTPEGWKVRSIAPPWVDGVQFTDWHDLGH